MVWNNSPTLLLPLVDEPESIEWRALFRITK